MAIEVPTHQERRLALDSEFRRILGNNNTYFQPPATVQLKYPCIIYDLAGGEVRHADNYGYVIARKYDVIHVHRDPDVDLLDVMPKLFRYCKFDRRYVSDNLYHDAYTIYY